MNFFKIILVIVFFISTHLFSQEITVIELHSSPEGKEKNISDQETSIDELIFSESNNNNEIDENIINETETEIINENLDENSIDETETEIINENLDENSIEEDSKKDEDSSVIVSELGYWENSLKDDLDFLFNNVSLSSSKAINNYFIDTLIESSRIPQSYSQEEFDNLRIKTLIKMGHKQEAIRVLNNISTYEAYNDYYDQIKLDSYFATYALSEACNFKDSLQEFNENNNNIFLKVSIFCSFLENKPEEADLLNSLLLDTDDKDEYFQKIYFSLKKETNNPIVIIKGTFEESLFSLYSAMIRIGSLPFTKQFLDFDSTNLTLPIILSSSTEISLRLISAHRAYELGLFKAESLSALYQSVDFSKEELNNWEKTLANFTKKPELGMALLFQNARVQLLPITRLETLKEFWQYAIIHDLESLAYDVSRNLIELTEPSIELSDYSILIARAHIFNKNFQQAEKWILFFENYVSQNSELDQIELDNVKLLYNLHKSENKDTFIKNLKNNLITKIKKEEKLVGYAEILGTIFSMILSEDGMIDKINYEKKVVEERIMPSIYIINTINNSAENNRIGELILTILVSLEEKSWNSIHPQHLKIILESIKKAKLDNLFKDVIIEIFEESKII